MFEIEQLTADEEKTYEYFIDRCEFSFVQHSLNWRKAVFDIGKDIPYFIVAKKDDEIFCVLPLYHYKSKFGDLLTSIVWNTHSGICSRNALRKSIYRALFDHAITLAKNLNCTALSISTNPFMDDKKYYLDHFKPDYIMENFTQFTPVNEIFDKRANLIHPNYIKRTNLSRNLEKAKQQSIIILDDQTENKVDECFKIHQRRMNEVGGSCFPQEFFSKILANLTRKSKGKFIYAFYEERMISMCLFLQGKTIIDVHMLSMDSDYRRLGVNYLVAGYLLKWAYKNGFSIVNWMSSPRRSDGIYNWKKQWGSHDRTFLYLTRITGDISQWKNMDYQELSEAYNFHYVMPFNLLKNNTSRFTSKDELTKFVHTNPRPFFHEMTITS